MSYYKNMKLQYWLSSAASTYDNQPQGIIKLSITLEGKESQFSTKIKVLKSNWSKKGATVLSGDEKAEEKNAELRAIWKITEEIEKRLRQREIEYSVSTIVDILRYLQDTKGVSEKSALLEELRDKHFNAVLKREEDAKKLKLIDAIDLYRSYKNKRTDRVNTKNNYNAFFEKISAWQKATQIVYADEFNESAILALTEWMEDEGMKGSSIHIYTIFYIGAMRYAKRKGLIQINQVSDFVYEYKKTFDHTYLTDAEMLLLTLAPNLPEKMQRLRDAFHFKCLTSLHYTDYTNLSSEHISVQGTQVWLEKPRDKTGFEYCQILHPHAVQIISKYGRVENLPRFSYFDYYFSLLELGKIANIKKHLTSKVGRKTFAYMSLNKWGYSLEATAKMMGLNKTDTIAYYAKVGRERVEKEVKWNRM